MKEIIKTACESVDLIFLWVGLNCTLLNVKWACHCMSNQVPFPSLDRCLLQITVKTGCCRFLINILTCCQMLVVVACWMLRILNGCGSVVYVACSGQAQAPGRAGETAAGGAVEKTAGNVALHVFYLTQWWGVVNKERCRTVSPGEYTSFSKYIPMLIYFRRRQIIVSDEMCDTHQ